MKKKLVTLLTLSLFSAINCTDKKIITKSKQPWYTKVAKTSSDILKETFTYKSFWIDLLTVPITTSICDTLKILKHEYHLILVENDWKYRNISENIKTNLKSLLHLDTISYFGRIALTQLIFFVPSDGFKNSRKFLKGCLKEDQKNLKKYRQIYQNSNKKTEKVKKSLQKLISYFEKEIIRVKREIASLEAKKNEKHIAYATLIRPIIFKAFLHLGLAKISQYRITTHQDHQLCSDELYTLYIQNPAPILFVLKTDNNERTLLEVCKHIATLMKKNKLPQKQKNLATNASRLIARMTTKKSVIEATKIISESISPQNTNVKNNLKTLLYKLQKEIVQEAILINHLMLPNKEYESKDTKNIDQIKKQLIKYRKKGFFTKKVLPEKATITNDSLTCTMTLKLNDNTIIKQPFCEKLKNISTEHIAYTKGKSSGINCVDPLITAKGIAGMLRETPTQAFHNDFVGRENELKTTKNGKTKISPAGFVHILKNNGIDKFNSLMEHIKNKTTQQQCEHITSEWAHPKGFTSDPTNKTTAKKYGKKTSVFHHIFKNNDFYKLDKTLQKQAIKTMITNGLESHKETKTNQTPLDILEKNNKKLYNYAVDLEEQKTYEID